MTHTTQCSPGLGIRGLMDTIQNTTLRPLVGILDGGCSSVARSITEVGRWYNLVSVSGVAATPILSDKAQCTWMGGGQAVCVCV